MTARPGGADVTIRRAVPDDVDALHAIRLAVRENRLSRPDRIAREDYLRFLDADGRTFVAESGGTCLGFSAGDRARANVWALFVHPDAEGRGIGRALHDELLHWFFAVERLPRIWLTTAPGTRAARFYRAAGWSDAGVDAAGELRFELAAPRG